MPIPTATKSIGLVALIVLVLVGAGKAQNTPDKPQKPNCVPVPEDLVGWWPADIGTKDRTGKNKAEGGEGLDYTEGKVGKAFLFDSPDAHVRIPRLLSLETGSGLSIIFWMRPTKTGGYPITEWNDGKGHPGTHLYVWGAEGRLWFNLLGPKRENHFITSGAGIIKSGVYQHVAATYDMETGLARLYRNGVLMAEEYLGKFRPLTDRDLYLAFRTPDGYHFRGELDEVCLFDRSLSGSEVQAFYDAGSAGYCLPEDTE